MEKKTTKPEKDEPVKRKTALEKKTTKPEKDELVKRKTAFEYHAKLGSSLDEIRGVVWMDREDLERWIENQYGMDFDEVLQRFRGQGIAELRESLVEFAKTNAHVAKWLGQLMFGDQKTAGDDVTVRVWSEIDPTETLKKAKKKPKS